MQAALAVIISVLGAISIWSFSRYWWQRGCVNVVRRSSIIPLSKLFTLSSPGEAWDAITLLRSRVFAKEHWRLLFQLLVIIGATLACIFNGPIAQASLRSVCTRQKSRLGVKEAIEGGGSGGNVIIASVLWNETMQS